MKKRRADDRGIEALNALLSEELERRKRLEEDVLATISRLDVLNGKLPELTTRFELMFKLVREEVRDKIIDIAKKFETLEITLSSIAGLNGTVENLETLMKNHLKHHENLERERSSRTFKIVTIVLIAVLGVLQSYIVYKLTH